MHLAYSALRSNLDVQKINKLGSAKKRTQLKYVGYLTACKKYQEEIAAIQQYMPGWKPAFK
jgi:hypothetical protein